MNEVNAFSSVNGFKTIQSVEEAVELAILSKNSLVLTGKLNDYI